MIVTGPESGEPIGGPAAAALLLYRFGDGVDQRRPEQIGRLFVEDGLFRPGSEDVRGPADIEAFYTRRLVDPRRVTRHVWSNVEVRPLSDDLVEIRTVVTNYAFEPAISETELQMRVGNVLARCVRDAQDRWRFSEHLYERLFAASLPLSGGPPSPYGAPR